MFRHPMDLLVHLFKSTIHIETCRVQSKLLKQRSIIRVFDIRGLKNFLYSRLKNFYIHVAIIIITYCCLAESSHCCPLKSRPDAIGTETLVLMPQHMLQLF